MKTKSLLVTTPQGHSGELVKESRYSFNYQTKDVNCEASLALPLRAESYASGALFSIFQMNRPEGYLLDALKERFAKQINLDDMELLRITGENQIGRLRYQVPNASEKRARRGQVSRKEIIESNTSGELFEFLVDTYFASGISGFQPKVMVPDSDNEVSEKATVYTSDLIVKAAGDSYPFLAQNEFLCMEAAREAGISVPEFWLSNDGKLFVMTRFDIKDGIQLGLEDMSVLMGKSSDEKYQGSYEGVARAIDLYCGSNADESKTRLFEYVALSCLVRNGDAHLKNFSLLYDVPNGNVRLSPLYDVVTTTVYSIPHPKTGATKVDRTLALNLNKTKSYPMTEDLLAFGEKVCLVRNPLEIVERIKAGKKVACKNQADRINPAFLKSIKNEWEPAE